MESDELKILKVFIIMMKEKDLPTKRSGLVSDGREEDGRPPVFLILTGLYCSNNCSATFVRKSINSVLSLLLFTLYNTYALYKARSNKWKKVYDTICGFFLCIPSS